jgi:hypothetical protein
MRYSAKIIRLNSEADPALRGVALGRLCIRLNVPVSKVCADLDVSKATVYRWFTGQREVGKHLAVKVAAYYERLHSHHRTSHGTEVPR